MNFCKTPGCENFGVPPRKGAVIKGPGTKGHDRYVTGNKDDGSVIMRDIYS